MAIAAQNIMETSSFEGRPLRFLWLEVTGKCNLQCGHCYAGSSPTGTHGNMRLQHWIQVIDQAAMLGCRSIQFIGGEPTTYPYLIDLIECAADWKMAIEVYTNLVSIKSLQWQIFKYHHVSIATSFYSLDPAVHEAITQKQYSYRKTVENIQRVLDSGLPLRVGLIEMRDDQRIDETKQFLYGLGVKKIGYDRIRGVGRATDTVQVSNPNEALCGACTRGKAAVTPDGNVYPCVFSRHLKIGNVLDVPFQEIITGQRMTQTRTKLNIFFTKHPQRKSCEPNSCSPDDSCMPEKKLASQRCEPHECDPNCEPGECAPDIPSGCNPTHDCLPDWMKQPCQPTAPCSPDKESCSPEWDKDPNER